MKKLISNVFTNSIFKPILLLSALKTDTTLKTYYETKVRHYTLEDHTLLVMNEFEKYFSDVVLPIEQNLFRLLLALHDIGKPKAFLEGNKNLQYKYTVEIICNLKQNLPFSNEDVDKCISIVCCDTIGMYFQEKVSLEITVNNILTLASRTNISIENFFELISIYYQVDAGSYTKDAGGYQFLEFIFEYHNGFKIFNDKSNILKFSSYYEKKYNELEEALLNE